tara:strand:+ start:729 stop:980 length:252 start_codon:yes stop_codon:yes gene_type:complete
LRTQIHSLALAPGLREGEQGFTYEDGLREGHSFAETHVGKRFLIGLLTGALGRPFGVAIGFFLVGPAKLSLTFQTVAEQKGED